MNLNEIQENIPREETARQFYYMEKAAEHVHKLEEELGRKPTCCVTTFGCQMNVAPVTA